MVRACIRWTWLPATLFALALGLLAVVPSGSAVSAKGTYPAGDFETHLDGFSGVGTSRVTLSRDGAGRNSSRAMVVRTKKKGAATRSTRRFAGDHKRGATFKVSAWVRTSSERRVTLRVRETAGGKVLSKRVARPVVKPGKWTKVAVRITTTKKDSQLVLAIRAPQQASGDKLLVDDLAVAKTATGSAAAGEVGKLSNGCGYTARGIPSCGVLVGAAHGSNSDPATLESKVGGKLGVRRTYYTSTGVAKAVKTAQADIAAGRLPWISFKLPYSWGDMVAGKGDAWAKDLATRLAAVKGPVWVAFHHEPEGDGDIQQWRRMQERLAPIVRNAASNVAFTVVMTGWHQFYGDKKYSLAEIWPRNVKVDVAGFDIYQQYGVVKDGKTTTKWTDMAAYFRQIATWARANDVAWGLAETGVTDAAAKARPTEVPATVKLMEDYGAAAYSYFDTTLNSIANWSLTTSIKLDSFGKALSGSPKLR